MSTPAPAAGSAAVTLADRVHDAVLALPGVSDLHPGSFGEVATYAAGRRVVGVRVRPARTEIHVVTAWGSPVLETADAVRRTVETLTGTPVDVFVEDVAAPPAAFSAQPPATPGPRTRPRRTRSTS
ncbi:MAG: hypothetical protein ABJA89_07790 [Lapillicoccus sp.]